MTQRRLGIGAAWLVFGIIAVGLTDAIVLGLTTGYFGAGYNSPVLENIAEVAAFAAAGAMLDAFLLAFLLLVGMQLGRVLRLRDLPRFAFAMALAVFLPAAFALVSHRLHRVLGQVLGFDALIQLAGGGIGNAALEALTEAPAAALLLTGGLLLIAGAVRFANRRSARDAAAVTPPRSLDLLTLIAATAVPATAILTVATLWWPTLGFGLGHKASGQLLSLLVRLATDVDRDGFGLLTSPSDAAPFDAARHPFALEQAGNGIDENGVAGDLPAGFRPQLPFPVPERVGPRRPSFLLVFLESFRGDLVGRRLRGQEVTPTLNRLAREGSASGRTYAHFPLTWPSRAQLFQGRISPVPGGRTLIDDFHDLGYRVAYFSGQNDLHGGSESLVGFSRADSFYDARADRDERTSRTALPASLQVSSRRVLDRVRAYLEETASDVRPLFLYVNLVDNHYPYHHAGITPSFGIEPVSRSEIRPENAQRVLETYLQSSRHVDAAIGELLGIWKEFAGDAPILITADHGQSFYENGMLGHGQSVDASQSRVPLIVRGVGGAWPEPLGLADLRGLLLTHLFEDPGQARFETEPDRRVFQYVGSLDRPYVVALRGIDGAIAWDFERSMARQIDEAGAGTPASLEVAPVVWTWEWLQAAKAKSAASQPTR